MKLTRNRLKFSFRALALAGATCGMIAAASAQPYSHPLSWMPMEMPKISFNPTTLSLSTEAQTATKAVLAINTISTGGAMDLGKPNFNATTPASFDPAQPWSVLNGTAFSRRMGWYTIQTTLASDIQTAFGSGAGIWIEQLSASAGLQSYLAIGKFGVNANNTTTVDPLIGAYTGIFGTEGSSTKWKWDYKMDHNTYAVDLADITGPNQLFTATYKIYIGDSLGNELASAVSASTTTTWSWQSVPEPTALSLALLGFGGFLASRKRKA
jgi:hypothetical protein